MTQFFNFSPVKPENPEDIFMGTHPMSVGVTKLSTFCWMTSKSLLLSTELVFHTTSLQCSKEFQAKPCIECQSLVQCLFALLEFWNCGTVSNISVLFICSQIPLGPVKVNQVSHERNVLGKTKGILSIPYGHHALQNHKLFYTLGPHN